jgi:hypothetical protein
VRLHTTWNLWCATRMDGLQVVHVSLPGCPHVDHAQGSRAVWPAAPRAC